MSSAQHRRRWMNGTSALIRHLLLALRRYRTTMDLLYTVCTCNPMQSLGESTPSSTLRTSPNLQSTNETASSSSTYLQARYLLDLTALLAPSSPTFLHARLNNPTSSCHRPTSKTPPHRTRASSTCIPTTRQKKRTRTIPSQDSNRRTDLPPFLCPRDRQDYRDLAKPQILQIVEIMRVVLGDIVDLRRFNL